MTSPLLARLRAVVERAREVTDHPVHGAVGDQADAGQVRQDRVVGDIADPLDGGVHPVQQGTSGRHRGYVRSG